MATRDPYQVLGVARTASADEIRKAFRSLALRFHPDRNKSPQAPARFAEISEAYEILRYPETRKAYDLKAAQQRQQKTEQAQTQAPPQSQQVRTSTATSPKSKPGNMPTAEPLAKLAVLFSRGRFEDAEQLARKILESNPKEGLAYAVMGDIARARGDLNHAVNLYARAVQAEPRNVIFQQKYEELVNRSMTYEVTRGQPKAIVPLVVSSGVLFSCSAYMALTKEPPAFASILPVSSWTLGSVVMLFIMGLSMGVGLAMSGILDRFQDASSSSTGKISPAVALTGVALFNYWAAGILYLILGLTQNSLNKSTSRLFLGCLATLFIGLIGASLSPVLHPGQIGLWGGNLVYLGAVLGWMVTDSLRPS